MTDRHVAERPRSLVADVVVTDEGGWPVAVVEVKNHSRLTAEIATSLRATLLEHGMASPRIPYFLVVSQDRGFLWVQQPHIGPEAPPTADFPMQPVVIRYASWLPSGERLSGSALEFVVAGWLANLSAGIGPDLAEVTEPLMGTGFLEALLGAAVRINERS